MGVAGMTYSIPTAFLGTLALGIFCFPVALACAYLRKRTANPYSKAVLDGFETGATWGGLVITCASCILLCVFAEPS